MQLKPPHANVLMDLASKLPAAARMYAILQALYGVDMPTVGDRLSPVWDHSFTLDEFYKKFFHKGCYFYDKKTRKKDNAPSPEQLEHDPTCPCSKTIADIVFDSRFGIKAKSKVQWKTDYQRRFPRVDIDKLLQQKIFGCVSSTITNNFRQLSTKRYLQKTEEGFKRVAADYFPEALLAVDFESSEISTEFVSGSKIGLTTFIERFGKPINSIQRFYLDTDYIVNVDEEEICDVLLSAWSKEPVSLVKFTYSSISEGKNFECVVYPVLFIYPTRAVYLVAFGGNPKAKIAWYNYRIDRIQNITEIKQKDITPEQHELYDCPDLNPEWAIEQWNSAYGFDFYQEAEEMLLRFDGDFYKRYVANTEREIDFEPMRQDRSYGEAKKFLVDRRQHDQLKVLEKCNQKDIYCKVPYRVKDNNVIMRLRAWGSYVEVIYPPDLRKRMAEDIFTTWQHYDDKENR